MKLHSKYRLNPTIPVCFWCRKPKNEIALLGSAYPDKAPQEMILNYNPCPDCEEQQAKGVLLIEATREPQSPEQITLADGYPTGRYIILSDAGIKAILKDPQRAEEIIENKRVFLEPDSFKQALEFLEKLEENSQ